MIDKENFAIANLIPIFLTLTISCIRIVKSIIINYSRIIIRFTIFIYLNYLSKFSELFI